MKSEKGMGRCFLGVGGYGKETEGSETKDRGFPRKGVRGQAWKKTNSCEGKRVSNKNSWGGNRGCQTGGVRERTMRDRKGKRCRPEKEQITPVGSELCGRKSKKGGTDGGGGRRLLTKGGNKELKLTRVAQYANSLDGRKKQKSKKTKGEMNQKNP